MLQVLNLLQTRTTINVRQRIRQRGRILQYKQTHYTPNKSSLTIPISVLGSGYLRRLVRSNTDEAHRLIGRVDWQAFATGVPAAALPAPVPVQGVRWHPSGAWRVTFKKSDMHHNFFVNCSCYFRVTQHGFVQARAKAVAYRQTLENEWTQLQHTWNKLHSAKITMTSAGTKSSTSM